MFSVRKVAEVRICVSEVRNGKFHTGKKHDLVTPSPVVGGGRQFGNDQGGGAHFTEKKHRSRIAGVGHQVGEGHGPFQRRRENLCVVTLWRACVENKKRQKRGGNNDRNKDQY